MLHTLSRVVFEQTGLQMSRIATMSSTELGSPGWPNGHAQWMRMLCMVEVPELASLSAHRSQALPLKKARSTEAVTRAWS
jgi:hypothetical protein